MDGVAGTDGENGVDGENGTDGEDGEDGEDVTVSPAGTTGLNLTIDGVDSTANGDAFDVVLTFTITLDGVPYVDNDGVPGETNGFANLDQKRFYAVQYDASAGTFDNSVGFDLKTITAVPGTLGQYTIMAEGAAYAPEDSDAQAYGYVADGALHTEQPAGSHVHLYDYVSNAALAFGAAVTDPYESLANVAGCEKCHGSPYLKHGYRGSQVEGIGDFAACKSCHYDTRSGGHEDWQILVDDPLRYVELHDGAELTTEEEDYYAYTANLMNDVHMAHAMEFPYPQRMSNCVTCHEGKMDEVFAEENFTGTTCRSCHAVTGDEEYGTAEHALNTIWEEAGVESIHDIDADCTSCHADGKAAAGVTLTTLHNGGYDPMIYTADGVRWGDALLITIDDASFNSNTSVLTVELTVEEVIEVDYVDAEDVTPDVRAALYGYDSKDFLVYVSGDETDNGSGSWTATVDLSSYAEDMGEDALYRRLEIVVRPDASLPVGDVDEDDASDCGNGAGEGCSRGYYCDQTECIPEDDIGIAPISPSRTFDLTANDFDDDYYADIVDVEKCETCHDALATTFHSPNRSGNIVTCRMCHNPTRAGSHLEMQSRSLDSYVHAIHSFQEFDPGDVDFDDPVEAVRYELHINHRFPNFTIQNCEACHNEGTYEVPDQTMTLPAVLSGSDTVDGRDIYGVGSVIVGPGARACGACHRSHLINEDDFSGLVSFNRHTELNGYAVPADTGYFDVLGTVMSYFGEESEVDVGVGPETCTVCHDGAGEDHQAVYDAYIDTN